MLAKGDMGDAEFQEELVYSAKVALATVDEDEVRDDGPAVGFGVGGVLEPAEAAAEHLLHHGIVVDALDCLNLELAVVGGLGFSVFEDDH